MHRILHHLEILRSPQEIILGPGIRIVAAGFLARVLDLPNCAKCLPTLAGFVDEKAETLHVRWKETFRIHAIRCGDGMLPPRRTELEITIQKHRFRPNHQTDIINQTS